MPNNWGRPPRHEMWQDLQALAIWVLIIGVVGYLLFPNFFKDIYTRLATPVTATGNLSDVNLPNTQNSVDTSTATDSSANILPSDGSSNVYSTLYSGRNDISSGYWVIFVAENAFNQLSVSSDTYAFLQRVIESDQKNGGKNAIILAANGQIQKYNVSDEIYAIISNLAIIDSRNHGQS